MPQPRSPVAAPSSGRVWRIWSLTALLGCCTLVLFALNRGTIVPASWGVESGTREDAFALFSFFQAIVTNSLLPSLLGLLILSRRPRHPIGRLLFLIGHFFGGVNFVQELTIFANFTTASRVPGALYIAWLGNVLWIVPFTLLFATVAVFPDGQLPTRRWRWVLWLISFFAASMFVGGVIEQPMASSFNLDNPFADSPFLVQVATILFILAMCGLVGAIVGLAVMSIVRFRRAVGIERQQWKWLAWSLLVSLLFVVAGSVLTFIFHSTLGQFMISTSAVMPMIGIGVAIMRYRLYDIDVIINRTLVYATLTVTIALMYVGSIILLQSLFRALSGQTSDLAIVASTLASAMMFDPLRRRIQRLIDHRFYRRKYNAEQVLATFATTLRGETDLDQLAGTILAVTETTMQPAHLSLWLPGEATAVQAD